MQKLLITVLLATLLGCAGRTGITKHFPYPVNGSIDYHVIAWANGEYGHAFNKFGPKESGITIMDKSYSNTLLEIKFQIVGGNIEWKCSEMTNSKFKITIYDSASYNNMDGANLIRDIQFKNDEKGWHVVP